MLLSSPRAEEHSVIPQKWSCTKWICLSKMYFVILVIDAFALHRPALVLWAKNWEILCCWKKNFAGTDIWNYAPSIWNWKFHLPFEISKPSIFWHPEARKTHTQLSSTERDNTMAGIWKIFSRARRERRLAHSSLRKHDFGELSNLTIFFWNDEVEHSWVDKRQWTHAQKYMVRKKTQLSWSAEKLFPHKGGDAVE